MADKFTTKVQKVKCGRCNGKGVETCSCCGGTGNIPGDSWGCQNCNETGKSKCIVCDGRGWNFEDV